MTNDNFNKVNCDLQYVIYPLEIKRFHIEMQNRQRKGRAVKLFIGKSLGLGDNLLMSLNRYICDENI